MSEFQNNSLHREMSREIKLDNLDDLAASLQLSKLIYETLRTKEPFIVGDTQHNLGITHKFSRNTVDMRFLLKNALIDDFDIINPRKEVEGLGIKIIARDKNVPGRTLSFTEMTSVKGHELLNNAFFVYDSHDAYISDEHLKVDPVALESDIIPWLLTQEGYSKEKIVRIIQEETDPVRYAADILSKRADQIIQVEELRADINPDFIIGGQRIEERDPKNPLKRVGIQYYNLWLTAHFDTEEYGTVSERTIIKFSPNDPFMLHPDSPTTSVSVEVETEKPISTHQMTKLIQECALDKADGSSVNLLNNLTKAYQAASESTQVQL